MEFSSHKDGVSSCVSTFTVSEYTLVCVCSLSVAKLLCDEQGTFPTQWLIQLRWL